MPERETSVIFPLSDGVVHSAGVLDWKWKDVMRPIGRTGIVVPPLGFGSFKIGRNQGVKYPVPYALPDQKDVETLLNSVLDLGCHLIDTAPAYGLSEERIGQAIGHRRDEFVLSTKVGETFIDGHSQFDFSGPAIRHSIETSLRRLRTDVLDLVLIHSSGDDYRIQTESETVAVLQEFRERGMIRAIGLSGKTVRGAEYALTWADALMVEYNLNDESHSEVIRRAAAADVAVFVKKGLGSGKLDPEKSIRFVLTHPGVSSLIVGSLNFDNFRRNWMTAMNLRSS